MTAKKPTSRKKTKKTFGEEIIEGLEEFRDVLESGEPIGEHFTMRTVDLELEPHDYSPEDVKATRAKLRASQAVFAKLLGVSAKTVQSWEQGHVPPPMARRLLDLINENPARWLDLLRRGATEKSGNERAA